MTAVTVMMTVEENVGVREYLSDKWTDGVLVFCRVWNLPICWQNSRYCSSGGREETKLQVEGLVIDRAVDVVDYYSIPLRPDGIFTTHPFKTSSSHIAGPSKYCFYRLLATWPYPVSHYHLPLLIQIVHDPLVLPTSTPFVLTVTHVPYSTTAVVPLSTSSFRRPYLEPEGKYDSHTSEIRSSSSDTKTSIQGS
ncbi:hypothetical protein K435DRAFT_837567 [Dendrothele bispora CBS 962.96]|uniref:Uncharacterized protein n=1 Tax=Dendrothele bispora (strain CBS 962.96) TaxID=1314807 RepID=A0A4S8MBA2_DENBC|nr:hypothetical protein K435DRAFT_837567 [Dendrothele bispora CBS 962.96]